MTCQQVLETARTCSGPYCKVCPVCNGRACKNGPGSKGSGPVGAVKMHYGDKFTDEEYNAILVPACAKAGIAAFTGDGDNPTVFTAAAKASGAKVFAMDIDAAGLPFLKGLNPPAGSKTVEELKEITRDMLF